MSADESITSLSEAVAALGALPMPAGPALERDIEDELTGARLSLYEEELETARLRLALKSAKRGRSRLRARVAELEAERHSTNEALSDAAERMRADRDRIAELEAAPKTVFRASHDSIVMGHYTTREAAQAHCEAKVQEEEPEGSILHLSWSADDIGPDAEYELHITPARTGGLIRGTGYVVTPLEVASAYDPDADE